MLTQFFRSINWVDVALAALFARVIFVSVKSGFVAEVFKFLGVIVALFVSLHYYSSLAAFLADHTTLAVESWQFVVFVSLWAGVTFLFRLLRTGILLLFKVETTHQGVDKYAAGFLGGGRAIFLASMLIFSLLLLRHPYLQNQTVHAYGYKVAAKAAPNTYSFLFHNVVGKLAEGERFNEDVFAVVGSHGANTK